MSLNGHDHIIRTWPRHIWKQLGQLLIPLVEYLRINSNMRRSFFLTFYLHIWPCHVACGILVLQPGIEPKPLAVEAQSLNHWTSKDFPRSYFLLVVLLVLLFKSCCSWYLLSFGLPAHLYMQALPFHLFLLPREGPKCRKKSHEDPPECPVHSAV